MVKSVQRPQFAPVAARLARGEVPPGVVSLLTDKSWPDDLAEVVYIDHFGNAMSGLRGSVISNDALITVGGRQLRQAATFAAVPPGEAFWYVNANGLVELAVNQGRANQCLQLKIGDTIHWE